MFSTYVFFERAFLDGADTAISAASAYARALVSLFVVFIVGANAVSMAMEGYVIVGSPIWIPAILLLMPSVAGLGLSVGLLVSLKSRSFMEAQQWAGILVLPIVILAGVLLVLTWVLISRIGPRFEREKVVSTL